MEVKQEPPDLYDVVVKTETDVVDCVFGFGDTDNNCENIGGIKQEVIECGMTEIELDLPANINCDSPQFVSITVKKERFDVVDINETKEEISEFIQVKTESELLTSDCDLPTLKSESVEYWDNFVQPCSSKYTGKTTANVAKKKRCFSCIVCQKNVPSKSRSEHIDGHFEKNFVVCAFCGKLLTKIDFFQHHFIHLVKNKPRNVSLKIDDVSSMHKNLIVHTNEKPFNCDICSKKFKKKYALRQHFIVHTNEKPFTCDICSKNFNHKCNLQRHLLTHSDEKPFKCDTCSKTFKCKSNLQAHLLTHDDKKLFKCTICPKEFKRNFALNLHLKTHTDEKPFKCAICLTTFKQKSYLKDHLLIHNDTKLYKCSICSKEFKRNSGLRQHLKTHTDEKPFKCGVCFTKFKHKSVLKDHLLVHNDKKLFKCSICSKEFKRNFGLRQHLKSHTDEKPFKCDICDKTFKFNYSLHRHFKTHTESVTFRSTEFKSNTH